MIDFVDILNYPPNAYPFFFLLFSIVYFLGWEIYILWKKFPRDWKKSLLFFGSALFHLFIIYSLQGYDYLLFALKIEGAVTMVGFFIFLLFNAMKIQKKQQANKLLSMKEKKTWKYNLDATMLFVVVFVFIFIIPMVYVVLLNEAENIAIYDQFEKITVPIYITIAVLLTAHSHIKFIFK